MSAPMTAKLKKLSDFNDSQAKAVLGAMVYEDVSKLSYKEAYRLWVPLMSGYMPDEQIADMQNGNGRIDIYGLKGLIDDLQGDWVHWIYEPRDAQLFKLTADCLPRPPLFYHEHPRVNDSPVWRKAAEDEGYRRIGELWSMHDPNPDFVYSEDDTDLRYIG